VKASRHCRVKSAEVRYMPWGTTRYTSGTTPTTFLFTGQRIETSFGLYYYGARWYDPATGRFIQADTVIPQQQGVQAWDRYAYVNNNPLNMVDPTGHGGTTTKQTNSGKSPTTEEETTGHYRDCPRDINCDGIPQDNNDALQDNNDDMVATLQTLANGAQDIATLIDLGFAIPEGVIITTGVASGGPETIPVAVGGFDIIYNVSGGNLAETFFSGVSLLFTGLADYADDGQLGDAFLTSAITFGAGLAMPDPIGDLVIDGYASGYNHGIFSGATDILNGASFFNNRP
jgi:RHS repeat-associated protein